MVGRLRRKELYSILNSAIVEETLDSSTIWWLIFTRIAPTKENKVKEWLRKHLPPDTLDVEGLQTLNPWLQRRLGWGDVRTTPELLVVLRQEARLPALSLEDELVADRHQLAREELRIRQPQIHVFAANPVFCTHWGRSAQLAKRYGSEDMFRILEGTAAIMAIPDKAPVQALPAAPLALSSGATTPLPVAAQSPDLNSMWDNVIKGIPVTDNIQLRTTCQLLRQAAFCRVTSFARNSRRVFFEKPEQDSDSDEDEQRQDRAHTVHVWGSEPFRVVNMKAEYPEILQCILQELGEDVTFARFLVKLLYVVRQSTPPCPSLDPKLLDQAKGIWALHVGRKPVEALRAHELDLLDNVLARPRIIRCRVCYKPCDDAKYRMHSSCKQHMIECDKCHVKCNCPSRLMKVPERSKVDTGEDAAENERKYRKRKAEIESLNLATTMWCRSKCQKCGSYAHDSVCPKPECRPKSTKVAR